MEGKEHKLTSWYHPNASLGDGKLIPLTRLTARGGPDFDHDLALVHEEAHVHLSAILDSLHTIRRQLNDAGTEEAQSHDLCVAEVAAFDVSSHDC